MKTIIKNGEIVNPKNNLQMRASIIIEEGIIAEIVPESVTVEATSKDQVIDATGRVIAPGFIDLHTHLRQPGQDEKETLKTGTLAAAKGGYTTVLCMPNTKPTLDDATSLLMLVDKLKDAVIEVRPIGAITKGIQGKVPADYEAMLDNGIVGLSDDGRTTMSQSLMKEAFAFSNKHDLRVFTHCEDHEISNQYTHEKYPKSAEYKIVERDIALAKSMSSGVHICHISTAETLAIIKNEKSKHITCEVCPHHFALSEERLEKIGVATMDPLAKVNPPIRKEADRKALIKGLLEGDIQAIATDHAPHESATKEGTYDEATYGISGIETAFQLAYQTLCIEEKMPLMQLIGLMTYQPAQIAKLQRGSIEVGNRADLVLLDLNKKWKLDPETFVSMGKNSPVKGMEGQGEVVMTIVKGEVVYVNR